MTLLYRKIVAALLADMEAGRVRTGERLPSEHELARRFGVSRITAKRALDELTAAGQAERVRGRGTFALTGGALGGRERPAPSDPLIGLVLPDFSETYGVKLLYALEERCAAAGAHLVVKRTLGDAAREAAAIAALLRLGVRGLVVFPVHGEHYQPVLLELVLQGFPVVLVDRYLREIPAPAVVTDNREAAAALTAHVLTAGCREVAFVSPPAEHTSALEDRLLGLETALARRGLVPAGVLTLRSSLPGRFTGENISEDERRVRRFVHERPGLDALIVSEYNLARVVADALKNGGKRVPEDVAVACFDAPSEPLGKPFFTHVRQGEAAMGELAMDLLLRQFGGERVTGAHTLPFELIPGRSTRRNVHDATRNVQPTSGKVGTVRPAPGGPARRREAT